VRTKIALTIADARVIADACRAEAVRNQWSVTIAILDEAAQLLYLERLDARPLTVDIAIDKARTAIAIRAPSAHWQERVAASPNMMALTSLLPLQGAVPLMYQGSCIGAVGVSGVKAEEDEQVARAGAACVEQLALER
jgi:glc operon protein GlcG